MTGLPQQIKIRVGILRTTLWLLYTVHSTTSEIFFFHKLFSCSHHLSSLESFSFVLKNDPSSHNMMELFFSTHSWVVMLCANISSHPYHALLDHFGLSIAGVFILFMLFFSQFHAVPLP